MTCSAALDCLYSVHQLCFHVNNQSAKRSNQTLIQLTVHAHSINKKCKIVGSFDGRAFNITAPQMLANNQYFNMIADRVFHSSSKQSSCRNHLFHVLEGEKNCILCEFQLQQNFTFNNKYIIPGTKRWSSSFMMIYVPPFQTTKKGHSIFFRMFNSPSR